jgi:hypothetical protein
MEVLLYIVIAVVVVVAAVLAYAATRPDSFRIERRITIDTPPDRVAPLVADFNAWRAWSPYEGRDPDMRRTLSGAPAGKGAVYQWEGNNQVGQGRMEVLESTPGRILIKLDFIKPFAANNTAEFTFTPVDRPIGPMASNVPTTDVIWAMFGPSPFMSKLMGVFINIDRMVGKDFEAGLANLKAKAEGRA